MTQIKRRAFMAMLFGAGAALALSPPAQAIRHWRGRGRYGYRGGRARSGGRLYSHRRSSYQNVSYSGESDPVAARSRVIGDVRRSDFSRAREAPVNRTFRRPPQASSAYSATRSRNNDGVLTEENVYSFRRRFDSDQSRKAMRSALGEPAEQTWTKDRWKIKRTDIYGKPAPDGWFEADYGLTGINSDSKTVRPPKADW